ncbi:hypothetical protein IIA15_05860 [candidate division TA06 bacterium]|nr:hypothetical protein [candidate division TA06 bacterium]
MKFKQVKLDPNKPNFAAEELPEPQMQSVEDIREIYLSWAERSEVMEVIRGREFRVIAVDLDKLIKEPIPHGIFAGKPRFISEGLAKRLGVKPVPYPVEMWTWLNTTLLGRQMEIAYTQGSTEFASSQQQNLLESLGYMPDNFRKWAHEVIAEEGEHGIQMAYWLMTEDGSKLSKLLSEDLFARVSNSEEPDLQQPLREFNPPVLTLPEFAHYFTKQDLDGWSQLTQSKFNCSALYAGQMRFFLRQEGRHLSSGDNIIKAYIQAGRIPMRLHLKMEWKWEAIGYRLHGNPVNSGGAQMSYQLGIKGPLRSLDRGGSYTIPFPGEPNGFKTFDIHPEMDKRNLNGFNLSVFRDVVKSKNETISGMLTPKQQKEAKEFLKEVIRYVPDKVRKEMLGESKSTQGEFVIPTTAISWRPPHMAYEIEDDPWPFMQGYTTDLFGYPIPSEKEYREYRELVDFNEEDQEEIRELTKTKGWMVETPVGSKGDVYKDGPVQPGKNGTLLFHFKAEEKSPKFDKIFTFPQAVREYQKETKPSGKKKAFELKGTDGFDTLLEALHPDPKTQ